MRIYQIIVWLLIITCATASAQEPPPAKVVTAKITKSEVSENQPFIGLLYYDRISKVSSEVSGLVAGIAVNAGDRVEKDSVLVRLNTDILDKQIAVTRTRIEQSAIRIKHAEKNYQRLDALFAEQGVSEQDVDDAFFTHQESLKDKEIAEKEHEQLLLQKKKSVIKAPFSGVILEKNVDTGDWVQPGAQLVRLGSVQDLFVRVPVAETLLRFVELNAEVPVLINAFDREIQGTIEDIAPLADPQTKNVFLKIRIPLQDKVAANMSATVHIPTSDKKELMLIPRDALIKFQGQDFVYTVKEGKAAILPINIVTYLGDSVGADNPYFVEGMEVVVEGNERLRPDQAVVVAGDE